MGMLFAGLLHLGCGMTSTIQPFLLCVIPAPVDDSGNPCAGSDLAKRGQHAVQAAGNIDRSACQRPIQRLSCDDFQEIYGHIVKKHCGDDRCVFSCCINIRPLAEQKISDIAFDFCERSCGWSATRTLQRQDSRLAARPSMCFPEESF